MVQTQQARKNSGSILDRFRSIAPGNGHWAAAVLVGVAVVLLIFILPLHVPLKPLRAVSTSYLVGFNNRISAYAAAGLSALVLLLTLRFRQPGRIEALPEGSRRLTAGFVACVIGVSAAILAVISWLVVLSHNRYLGDAGYIIEQATVLHETGRTLYTQIEFAYGPLLLLPEIWLSQLLHCSITAAYFVLFVFESSLGLLIVAWVLNELPIRNSLRKAALILLAFGAITPHLGMNYTFFRMASPLAVLLFATRRRSPWQCLLLLSAGEALELLISPELGLAMSVGVLAFGFLRLWQEKDWRWLATAFVPLGVLATLLLTLGRSFLKAAATFSGGGFNLPVGPYPHILILLAALVWIVPVGLGRTVHLREPGSARLLAFYAVSLALMPAALGRCDPLHVFFDGIGVLLLSLIGMSLASRGARIGWVACLLLLGVWNHFVNERLFDPRTAIVLRQSLMPHVPGPLRRPVAAVLSRRHGTLRETLLEPTVPEYHLDPAVLNELVGSAAIVTPLEISPAVEDDLKRTHHYSPGYLAFWTNMLGPAVEDRSIHEVNEYPWMLLPSKFEYAQQKPEDLWLNQGLQVPYHQRNPIPYYPSKAFFENRDQHWTRVRTFGPYVLYRHNQDGSFTHEAGDPSQVP